MSLADELSTSIADAACRNSSFVPSILSLALKALSISSDIVSLKVLGILDPYQVIGGFEMSTFNTSSPESVSSCKDSTSCRPFKTD
jgi:hypothetical protein